MANRATQAVPRWEKVTDHAAFSPRDTAEDAVFLDRMWLSNGYYHGGVLTRDLWASSDGESWNEVSTATPYDGYSEMAVFQDRLWAVKNSVWSSVNGVDWKQVLDETPFGIRGYGELVVHDGRMWQLGSGSDVWFTDDGKEWTCALEHAPFGARCASAVAVYKDRLWLMGGRISRPNSPPEKGYKKITTFNDVWCSEDGRTWKRVLEHAPWSPRMWFIAKVYGDRLWLIGGFDNVHRRNLGDVWSTHDGVHWECFTADPVFEPRHEPTVYVYEGSLWVAAGNTWPVKNDVWRLTLHA